MGVRSLLKRLQKAEERSFQAQRFGRWVDDFEADGQQRVADGRMDPTDFQELMYCWRRWLRDGYSMKV